MFRLCKDDEDLHGVVLFVAVTARLLHFLVASGSAFALINVRMECHGVSTLSKLIIWNVALGGGTNVARC